MHSDGYYEIKKARLTRVRPLLRTSLDANYSDLGTMTGHMRTEPSSILPAQTIIGVHLLHFELSNEIGPVALMLPFKRDYCIESFGRMRRYLSVPLH